MKAYGWRLIHWKLLCFSLFLQKTLYPGRKDLGRLVKTGFSGPFFGVGDGHFGPHEFLVRDGYLGTKNSGQKYDQQAISNGCGRGKKTNRL